ncbi:DUF1127 domain-containing protein [Azospirillum brasilense]|uniref:DUF1127 domain-containing protein n=1 Tax=Azospirillum brasilense TaxID=192 RepID=UPI00190E3AAF|nr:DUF1127 domain-containing protein [Azospirillum brasilense]MBK3737347.1 DUF1127 domain-containing protein [Azospirillum brasilense]
MPTLPVVRAFGATLPKSLASALLGTVRKLMERRTQRAATPDRLDDRLLRDIGVSRSDLMAADRLGKPPRRRGGR